MVWRCSDGGRIRRGVVMLEMTHNLPVSVSSATSSTSFVLQYQTKQVQKQYNISTQESFVVVVVAAAVVVVVFHNAPVCHHQRTPGTKNELKYSNIIYICAMLKFRYNNSYNKKLIMR